MRFREGTITAQDGKRLYYRDYGPRHGSPTPVICLGGLTRNSTDFHRVASRLGQERRVICPDYRGRGRSDYDDDWRNYMPPRIAYDIGTMLTALGIGEVVGIGTSFGGLLIMGLAVFRPTAVKGAVLNDVGPELGAEGHEHVRAYVAEGRPLPDWDAAVAELKRMMPDLSIPEPQDENWLRAAKSTWRRGEDGMLHPDFDTRIARTMADPHDLPDLWPMFHALNGRPLAVIRGESSAILLQSTFEKMREARPDMIAVTIPGVGHAPNLDEPPSRAAIDAVLDRVDQNTGHP